MLKISCSVPLAPLSSTYQPSVQLGRRDSNDYKTSILLMGKSHMSPKCKHKKGAKNPPCSLGDVSVSLVYCPQVGASGKKQQLKMQLLAAKTLPILDFYFSYPRILIFPLYEPRCQIDSSSANATIVIESEGSFDIMPPFMWGALPPSRIKIYK